MEQWCLRVAEVERGAAFTEWDCFHSIVSTVYLWFVWFPNHELFLISQLFEALSRSSCVCAVA